MMSNVMPVSYSRIAKRFVLHAYDVFALVAITVIVSACLPRTAYAYVDPSVMTYTIQALAGVAVALSAVAGVVFRRTRKKIFKLLRIEPKHEVEPEITRIDPNRKAEVDAIAREALRKSEADRVGRVSDYAPDWKKRLPAALAVACLFVFTFMIVAPYELIAGNESSLVFGLSQLWGVFVLPAIAVALVLTLIVSILRGKGFNLVLMLLFGFSLATYIQVAVLNGQLPSSDGSNVDWSNYTTITCVTLLVWIAIFIAPYVLSNLNRSRARILVTVVSVVLIVVQAAGVVSLFMPKQGAASDGAQAPPSQLVTTEQGMLTVSPKDNIIVFVLDMYDENIDLVPGVSSHPDLLKEMTGFTWFQNAAGSITPTRDAVPTILTGHELTHDENYEEFTKGRFEDATYLSDLKAAGYNVGIYTDVIDPNIAYFKDNLSNAHVLDGSAGSAISLNEVGALKSIYMCALFRDLPWTLKPFFWFYTDDINTAMVSQTIAEGEQAAEIGAGTPYTINDPLFGDKLKGMGLSATDDGEKGSFRFIHLMGPHYPYTMDSNGRRVEQTTREEQAVGSMNLVSEYLRQLKALGLYDDATIIITSDHGWFISSDPFSLTDTAVDPIMLVKPPLSAEEAAQPIVESDAPVSLLDIMPTALACAGVPDSGAGDGVNAFSVTDPDRVRTYRHLSKDAEGQEHGIVEYEIIGDSSELGNWIPTGWIMHYPEGYWEQR